MVEYLPDKQTVVLRLTGELTSEAMADYTRQSIRLANEHGASRALVDCSGLEDISATMADIYKLPDAYIELGLSRKTRIALVVRKDNSRADLYSFYDDVTHNRGFSVRLFDSLDEAWAWLA